MQILLTIPYSVNRVSGAKSLPSGLGEIFALFFTHVLHVHQRPQPLSGKDGILKS